MNIGQLSPRFFVAGQIIAEYPTEIAAQSSKSTVNNRPDDKSAGRPKSDDLARVASDLGMHYSYVPVISGQITQQDADDFNRICNELEGSILLFCRSGARCTVL
jgi:uncharacterized protein (TIGR01244 family)